MQSDASLSPWHHLDPPIHRTEQDRNEGKNSGMPHSWDLTFPTGVGQGSPECCALDVASWDVKRSFSNILLRCLYPYMFVQSTLDVCKWLVFMCILRVPDIRPEKSSPVPCPKWRLAGELWFPAALAAILSCGTLMYAWWKVGAGYLFVSWVGMLIFALAFLQA